MEARAGLPRVGSARKTVDVAEDGFRRSLVDLYRKPKSGLPENPKGKEETED
jgi:hypothetical protein